jgi:hypothetical protein
VLFRSNALLAVVVVIVTLNGNNALPSPDDVNLLNIPITLIHV